MSNRYVASILCAAFLPALSAAQLYEAVEPHMGTLFRIKLYANDEAAAKTAFHAAFERIAQLDYILSDYNPASELNLSAQAAASNPVPVSFDLATVIKASQEISAESGGAFDITVGVLTKLWRTARHDQRLPDPAAIAAAREKCDYRKLHLDTTSQTLKLDLSGMQLDVGGIAKGYAADEALLVLAKFGIQRALVAASGDLAFGDPPPDQPGWKIGIDSLDRADKPFTRVITLANAAVSTSGDTEQFLRVGSHHYSHIIDPGTGMGLETEVSVTTISRRGIVADAAATAISVLGREKGLAFVERHPGLAAFILEKSGQQTRAFESIKFKETYGDR